jgi:hypothetical protein
LMPIALRIRLIFTSISSCSLSSLRLSLASDSPKDIGYGEKVF